MLDSQLTSSCEKTKLSDCFDSWGSKKSIVNCEDVLVLNYIQAEHNATIKGFHKTKTEKNPNNKNTKQTKKEHVAITSYL